MRHDWIGSAEYAAYKALEQRVRAPRAQRIAQAGIVLLGVLLGR